jgi:Cu(I)/Ag(I) efflux system membrane protein CusA/SilA
VLMYWFIRGKIYSEDKHPISRLLRHAYRPVLRWALHWRWALVVAGGLIIAVTWFPARQLGSEFMPPLWEGDLLYMPSTFPGISITKAKELLQQTDKILKSFPEVDTVFGKVGRAETATDPAPLSMVETTVLLKDPKEWPEGMTHDELIAEMDKALQFPGVTNVWTMPIKNRIDMLSTGIKTPVGIKIGGPDLKELERLGKEVEAAVKKLPNTRSVYAERVMGGNYFDFDINRAAAARYGLSIGDVEDVIQSAIGGMNVSWTVEGLERYPINVRYPRELRDSPQRLSETLVATPQGVQVPLGQLADIRIHQGPPGIKSENARPNAWVFIDLDTSDVGGWVDNARKVIAREVEIPAGYTMFWSGQYEYMQRAKQRLLLIVPITLFLIFLILYLSTRSLIKTAIVLLAVPLSIVGSIWLLYLLHYNWSIAVWVGLIALAGLATELGVVMLLYLDISYEGHARESHMASYADLADAVSSGATKRIRPMAMTALAILLSLVPLMWSTGTGADVMRRIAAPMIGGVLTAFLGILVVFPAMYFIWRSIGLQKSPLE